MPTETITEARRGKKVQVERKFMPGYVLAKLNMNDDVYHLVKNTPKVTGFLGIDGQAPADQRSRSRADAQFQGRSRRRAEAQIKVDYEIGDAVKVLDGPFASFNGVVEELDFDKPRQGLGLDLRPRDAGRTGLRASRALEIKRSLISARTA